MATMLTKLVLLVALVAGVVLVAPPCEGQVAAITPISSVQGGAYRSALSGSTVTVEGVVTARRSNQFFIAEATSPDSLDATSEGLLVFTGSNPPVVVAVGDRVRVTGPASEFRPGNDAENMVITQINGRTGTVKLASGVPLPPAVVIGCEPGMLAPPASKIENPVGDVEAASVLLDPATNGLAFYESLEGMRVTIRRPVVVGPTNNFGETPVVASRADGSLCALASQATPRGGVIINETTDVYNPSRMLLDDTLLDYLPAGQGLKVGDVLEDITAIVDYSFGNYKFYATQVATVLASPLTPSPPLPLTSSPGVSMTIASINAENLSPVDPPSKFTRLAAAIVDGLRSPDIVGVVEVQDNDGPRGSGITAANGTVQQLIAAIESYGGPTYEYVQIDPVYNQDGGAPGGNIRQALLFNPATVSAASLPAGDATTANAVVADDACNGQPQLQYSPGRIDPTNSAFANSRKPMAVQLSVNGQPLFVIINHFNSKGGDQPLFGRNQPPARGSEAQRLKQATLVADFVAKILALQEQARVVVMGDLNDFAGSNALAKLYDAGLTNAFLLPEAPGLLRTPSNQRYSYNFEGNAQALDHILLSASLVPDAEVGVLHVNSEFPTGDQSTRFSDHDPLLVRVPGFNACLFRPNPCPSSKNQGGVVCVNAPGTVRGYNCVCRPGFAPQAAAAAGDNALSCKKV